MEGGIYADPSPERYQPTNRDEARHEHGAELVRPERFTKTRGMAVFVA